MPLGIVSNRDFELERNNSDSSVDEQVNGHKIDFDQIDESNDLIPKDYYDVDNNLPSKDSESRALESKMVETPVIIPEIVTSDQIKRAGRHNEIGNVPQSIRKLIAEESIENGNKSAKNLVNSLGMNLSDATISTYKNGNISPSNSVSAKDNDLLEYINQRKTKLGKKALNKMSLALNGLTAEKMEALEPKELSTIAKDMSIIVDKMQPTQRENEKFQPVQFVIMAPTINNESHYQVVKAKDNY